MAETRRILLRGLDGDEKLETVSRYARLLVEQGKRDPKIRGIAVKIISGCDNKDYRCEAVKLHEWVRDNIRYVKDPAFVERFATPERTLKERAGDCDDSSILLSALLESIGHETRLILLDGDLSGKFTHVIAQAKIGDKWHWMETTKKVPFDWAPQFTISHIIDKDSVGDKDMENLDDLFGIDGIEGPGRQGRNSSKQRRFYRPQYRAMPGRTDGRFLILRNQIGLGDIGELGELGEALGEIGDLGDYISTEFGALEQDIIGEFGDIGDVLDDAKRAISSALDIGSKVAAVKAQFSRLAQRVGRMRNRKASAILSEKLNRLSGYISKVESMNATVQGSISALRDIIAKAAQAVEEVKKKAIETAKAAKAKAEQLARALKEKALMAARAVKEAALRRVEQAKQIAQRANAALVQQASRVRAAAQQAAQGARAYAQQQVQRARATVQQAASQVAQRARSVVQTAQRYAAPVRSVVSSVAKRFGFRGLGDLGIAPLVIMGLVATISGLIGYIASQLTSIDSQASAAESGGSPATPETSTLPQAQPPESFAPQDTFSPAQSQASFTPQESYAPTETFAPAPAQTATQQIQPVPLPENVQAAVDRAQERIAQEYQSGDITREQARDQIVQIKERASEVAERIQPQEPYIPQASFSPGSEREYYASPAQEQRTEFYEEPLEPEETDFEPEPEDELDAEDLGDLGQSSAAARKRRSASSAARKKPKGTLTDSIVSTGKTLGLAAIVAWGVVTLAGKAIDRRA